MRRSPARQAGTFSSGMYPNETFALEGDVWKMAMGGEIDETYINSSELETGLGQTAGARWRVRPQAMRAGGPACRRPRRASPTRSTSRRIFSAPNMTAIAGRTCRHKLARDQADVVCLSQPCERTHAAALLPGLPQMRRLLKNGRAALNCRPPGRGRYSLASGRANTHTAEPPGRGCRISGVSWCMLLMRPLPQQPVTTATYCLPLTL